MQLADYDRAGGGTITVTLDSNVYVLTETGANTGVFQGADSTIAAGQTMTMVYSDPTAAPSGSDVCIADIAAPDTSNPGISVRKTLVDPISGLAVVGSQVTFEIVVINTGSVTLDPVQVVDTFDTTYLQFDSSNPTQSSTSAGSVTWNNIGALDPGESAKLRVTFVALSNTSGSVTTNNVTATGTPPTGPTVDDSDSADVQIVGPSVSITKTTTNPANRQALLGDLVTFEVVVTNDGDSVLDVVPLIDTYDAVCLSFYSASQAPYATGYGVLFWQDLTQTFGQNLGPGQSFTLDVTLRTLSICDPAVNNAEVAFASDVNGNPVPPVSDDDFVQTSAVYDYGDAPNSYGTLQAANGARHALSSDWTLQLGVVAADVDNDGQPTAAANGDDLAGSDDEDGVTTLPAILTPSTSVPLTVSVLNDTAVAATLACWIDFNRDGDFLDAGERASTAVGSSATQQTVNLTFTGYATPSAGTSYLRCRIASVAGQVADPVGTANNGEVEDYQVTIREVTPSIDIEKATNGEDADTPTGPVVLVGTAMTFSYVVTNTGNTPLANVTVTDDQLPDTTIDCGGGSNVIASLAANGGTATCTATTPAVAGQYANVGTVTGQPVDGIGDPIPGAQQQTDSDPSHYFGTVSSVGDYVWNDANGNGLQDEGAGYGLNSVTLNLYHDDGDGVFEPGSDDSYITSTVTAGDGGYTFENLWPGQVLGGSEYQHPRWRLRAYLRPGER